MIRERLRTLNDWISSWRSRTRCADPYAARAEWGRRAKPRLRLSVRIRLGFGLRREAWRRRARAGAYPELADLLGRHAYRLRRWRHSAAAACFELALPAEQDVERVANALPLASRPRLDRGQTGRVLSCQDRRARSIVRELGRGLEIAGSRTTTLALARLREPADAGRPPLADRALVWASRPRRMSEAGDAARRRCAALDWTGRESSD